MIVLDPYIIAVSDAVCNAQGEANPSANMSPLPRLKISPLDGELSEAENSEDFPERSPLFT